MSHFGEQVEALVRDVIGPEAKRNAIAMHLGLSFNTIKNWVEGDTPELSATMIEHVANKTNRDPDFIWHLWRESRLMEAPKGRTVTTTRTRPQRIRKLSDLKPRPGQSRL